MPHASQIRVATPLAVDIVSIDPAESPLAALDRALVFIGGGIGALRA